MYGLLTEIMDRTITFKLDTRDVTIASQTLFNNIFSYKKQTVVQKAEKPPRRIPLPFITKVKEECHQHGGRPDRLVCQHGGRTQESWEQVHLCGALTGLKQSVCHRNFILPSVGQSLGTLAGAKLANWVLTC